MATKIPAAVDQGDFPLARSNPTTGYAASGAARIYFEVVGDGPALVFIHAGVADHRMWEPQVEEFSSQYKVVRYDLRGFGKSTMPEEPFALRDDLLAVLRHLDIGKATLIGCSMGGTAAIDFTLEHPEMVEALVPVGSGLGGWNNWSEESTRLMTEMMSALQKGDMDAAFEISARYWIDGPSRDASRVDAKYRERARQLHRENFSPELFRHTEVPLDPPAIRRLSEIKCPTQIVIGDCDAQDLQKVANHLATEIAGARLTTIANAAHLPSLEHPVEFNRMLREFLDSVN
jgi:3-oxoadipate enol-lactonase